jgi:hypothetical protein
MRNHLHCTAAIAAILTGCLFSPAFAQTPQQSKQELKRALSDLDAWLGKGANGQKWHAYLQTDSLRSELVRGLELRPFVRVHEALEEWLNDLSAAESADLPGAAIGAKDTFVPTVPSGLDAAKSNLLAASTRLNGYLASGGANGRAWQKYLRSADLQAQLKASEPDTEVLQQLAQRYTADQRGLELDRFSDVRRALTAYDDALEARQAKDLRAQFESKLESLADRLKEYREKPSPQVAAAIGRELGWLERMRQARPLVRTIKRQYSQPNFYAQASVDIVGAGIERAVNEMTPLHDDILGTSIVGTGHTVGHLNVRLVPDDRRAIFDTLLVGNTSSRTVGYHGPAIIYSLGNTQIRGAERLTADATGFRSLPPTASAVTRTKITGISSTRGGILGNFVQRAASKKVGQSKGEAEYVGARHAEARIRERLEREVQTNLAKANADYLEKFRNPLLRRGEFPQLLKFSTTADRLLITGLLANSNQLGAPSPPPKPAASASLVVQLHQSMINNLATSFVGGRTFTKEEYERDRDKRADWQADEFKAAQTPQEGKASEADWTMTLDSPPITFTLGDKPRVVVHVKRYSAGDTDYKTPIDVTADYTIAIFENRVRLVRQGDVRAETVRKSAKTIALERILHTKFGRVFLEQLTFKPLVLPGRWEKAGTLNLTDLQSQGGWLLLSWAKAEASGAPPKDVAMVESQ